MVIVLLEHHRRWRLLAYWRVLARESLPLGWTALIGGGPHDRAVTDNSNGKVPTTTSRDYDVALLWLAALHKWPALGALRCAFLVGQCRCRSPDGAWLKLGVFANSDYDYNNYYGLQSATNGPATVSLCVGYFYK